MYIACYDIQRKTIIPWFTSIFVLLLFTFSPVCSVFAQTSDTLKIEPGSLIQNRDTGRKDSLPQAPNYKVSKDAIQDEVKRNAADSSEVDNLTKKYYLYGNAQVTYQDIVLNAGIIILDYENDLITAKPIPDSSGRLSSFPDFADGDQKFTADSIKYNYKSGKGKVYNMRTSQDDIQIIGTETKFIRAQGPDTTKNDIANTRSAVFTTCTHPQPHFGIRSNKVKIIPNKLAVVGPSNLELMGIPTPIAFPFGFIPLKSGRRTGLIFPNDYEYSPQLGFGLRGIGWFFPVGEHFNLTVTSNVYLKGSYGFNVASQFNKRYRRSGNFDLGFDSRKIENTSDGTFNRSNSYSLRASIRQDRRAHPISNLSGSINFQTNDYQSRVFNDAGNVLNSQLSSNLNFSMNWPDKPYSLSMGLTHSQNNQTRQVNISLPNLRFNTQSLYPFRKPGGKSTWYENTVIRYTGEVRNRFTATDTTLFEPETFRNAQFGVKQTATLSNSFKFLKAFNFNPSVNYQEVWYLKSLDRNFDPTQEIQVDTIFNADSTAFTLDTTILSYGDVNLDTLTGFSSWRTMNISAAVNTRVFFTWESGKNKGLVRGVRWELRPTISLNYSPNYLETDAFQTIQTDTRFPDDFSTFSRFQGNIYGSPPQQEEQLAIAYNLNNIFQARVWSKRDSTVKTTKLIDNIFINGRYNFAADTLKWSQIQARTTARLFKGITTLGINATFDPYKKNSSGRRINEWTGFNGILPFRFDNATLRANSNLTVSKIRALFEGKDEEVVTNVRESRRNRTATQVAQEDDFLSLFENFSVAHNLALRWTTDNDNNTTLDVTTHAINARGRIKLTTNWSARLGNFGYDFVRKGLSYPSIGLERDLHCWQFTADVAPTRGTFRFSIRVKPGTLDFIEVPYQRNNYDTINAF